MTNFMEFMICCLESSNLPLSAFDALILCLIPKKQAKKSSKAKLKEKFCGFWNKIVVVDLPVAAKSCQR